ncbi:MAG: glycosyltransferase family 1 protein [Terrimicrobiaceae bacterium]
MIPPRIGIVDLSMEGWAAGGIVTRIMAHALSQVGAKPIMLSRQNVGRNFPFAWKNLPNPRYLPGEWKLRKILRLGEKKFWTDFASKHRLDVVFPLVTPTKTGSTVKTIGWIPDFQHRHLPGNYSSLQLLELDTRFGKLASDSDLMLFSSLDAQKDFIDCFPKYAGKSRVAKFPSLFAFEAPHAEPDLASRAFNLPPKYLLIINQFWRHKNHAVAVEAVSILAKQGLKVPLVMAGLPSDYRDRKNDALTEVFQLISKGNLRENCILLGKVSREVIDSLLRSAAALIQPSRFEGWNTSVQDAGALGCPIFLSDLSVHREQCPHALGFFPEDEPALLAELIAKNWENLPARDGGELEAKALEKEKIFATDYGRLLLQYCQEIV